MHSSIESGLLVHRFGQGTNTAFFQYPENALTLDYFTERGHAIEAPILAKILILSEGRAWRPFVTAGPTVRRTSLDARHSSSVLSGALIGSIGGQPAVKRTVVNWNVDPAFGAGIDFKIARLHLEPEIRYSYWGAGKNSSILKNQVDFLLGFRF